MSKIVSINKQIATPDDLMTFSECAKVENCSVSYLYKLYYEGKIGRHKKGHYKVSLSEVRRAECGV